MSSEHAVDVIIPLGPGEAMDAPLLQRLDLFPDNWTITLACCPASEALGQRFCAENRKIRLTVAPQGRAAQMNQAVMQCDGLWLWFLHVDSILEASHIEQVSRTVSSSGRHLYCFPLAFTEDGPRLMGINALGANIRTSWFGVPFGDQGFLLQRALFDQASGYDQDADYGEDHLLVWQLRYQNVSVQMLAPPLGTSARRYKHRGWFNLTLLYQWRWLKQAAPWVLRRLYQKVRHLFSWKQSSS